MAEAVVKDMGDPSAQWKDQEGKFVARERTIAVDDLVGPTAELNALAKACRKVGAPQIADKIDKKTGMSSKLSIFEQYPRATTAGMIVGGAAVGFLGYKGYQKWQSKRLVGGVPARQVRMAPPPPIASVK